MGSGRRLPEGFRFQRGADGLLVGLSIVFLVKLKMVFADLVDWRLLPTWTWKPVKDFETAAGGMATSMAEGVGRFVNLGGTGGQSSSAILSPDAIGQAVTGVVQILGVPLVLTGSLTANTFEQVFIIVGFWIAFVIPLWNWVLRPGYFYIQHLDLV